MAFRQKLLDSGGCAFDAVITADYSDCCYTFTLRCETDSMGELSFRVTDPDSIRDITGKVTANGADLRFDGTVLAFESLADGLLSPVSAPWLVIHALRSGYLHSSGKESDGTALTLDDTFKGQSVRICVGFDPAQSPRSAEIYLQGKRYLSMDIRNFVLL